MSRTSTPEDFNDFCKAMRNRKMQTICSPRRRTIALIAQFARVYHVEKKLPEGLTHMMLN